MNRDKAIAVLQETLEDYHVEFGHLTKKHSQKEIQAAFDFLKRNPPPEVLPVTVKQMRQVLFNELGLQRSDVVSEMKQVVREETKGNLPGAVLQHVQENVSEKYILQLAREAIAQALNTTDLAKLLTTMAKEEAGRIVTEWLTDNIEFKAPQKRANRAT